MVHKCPRCATEFETASNFRDHLNRKYKCQPILQDIDIKDIIIENCKIESEAYRCVHCEKVCSNKFNFEKHIKVCKKNKNIDTDINSVEYLKEQLKEKDKQIEQLIQKTGNTINNTTINNNNNNTIVLLSFDNADRSHLTDEKKYYLLSRKFMAIPYLVKEIYFNPNVPQNHNVRITNLRDSLISLHVDNKWIKTDKNEVIEKLLDSNERYLENWANDSVDQYPDAIEKFQSYLEIKENDEKSDEKLKRELELLIFNKGKIYV
jgi:hypothetical protein